MMQTFNLKIHNIMKFLKNKTDHKIVQFLVRKSKLQKQNAT